MKNILYVLLLIGVGFISCIPRPTNSQDKILAYADTLIRKSYYDSALQILGSVSPESLYTPASQARYALLLTQAYDKNYIRHTDDSLIRIAVKYYDNSKDESMCAKAHYYWGRVY